MAESPKPAAAPDELAAPLDLLLTSATRPFASRMMPDATWARLGANLAQRPGAVAGRTATLARELGSIAAGKSHRARGGPTSASVTLPGNRIRCCTG
ncbi:poly(3-hydroxyalkanoate) synthetase domain protein [Mycobacterium kansasii 824]|nr:poly(3-hydroxyalkanoate) synthetase domain protein [Mycobacterium kansasii 824]